MMTLIRYLFPALLVFSGACLLPATVIAQAAEDSDPYIRQVPVTEQNDNHNVPWSRTAGGHMDNFDAEELRQRMMLLFGQGNPNPPPFVGSEVGGNQAVILQLGSDHRATISQGDIEGEQSGFSPPGNPDVNPPSFGSDGSGNFKAEVVQEGEQHTATIIQSGSGFGFDPPGLGTGIESPPPFNGDGFGGSSANMSQFGSDNSGLIVQFGNEHLAEIFQSGLQNLGEIMQSGLQNTGTIAQTGDFNEAMMRLIGEFNEIHVGQYGDYNSFKLDMTGNFNFLDLTQNGDHNEYDRLIDGNAILNETVIQNGNGNNAKQIGTLSNGRSASILQEGSAMEVIIRHGY